jgi:hypothetical protein
MSKDLVHAMPWQCMFATNSMGRISTVVLHAQAGFHINILLSHFGLKTSYLKEKLNSILPSLSVWIPCKK